MRVIANCCDLKLEIPCGAGKQHIRWLALVVATRMQKEKYPHAYRVPQRVMNHEGAILKPRAVISDVLEDGEEVTIDLRIGASIAEEDFESKEWLEESFGPEANLMECRFRWKSDPKIPQDWPIAVRGDYLVAPRWQGVYPQKDFGGHFEIPIETTEPGVDGTADWFASRKGPPGSSNYRFVFEDGKEDICKANPETLTRDGTMHHVEFTWDVPIAPEPYPEIDSRPSTASSRDGGQVDPRFEQDWESMRLKWIESFMKVRVKDVLTEFYAILIDLFDSYAFMGLDLSASQHTIGMDDWKHLVINCGLLKDQPEGVLSWREICSWFEDAAGAKDGKPYLAQRLTRAHYLELLMRVAGYAMCERPRAKYVPDQGRPPMPLDEGLFRFITDILIPVMDVYDDDVIRKDAVQHENLIVIQQHRQSIRSMYNFFSQPWVHYDHEKVVLPGTFRYVFEFAVEKLIEAENGAGAAGGNAAPVASAAGDAPKEGAEAEVKGSSVDFEAELSGDDKLTIDQLNHILEVYDEIIMRVTEQHPEPPEQRALLFWEFFEVLMHCCRELVSVSEMGQKLHEVLPCFVQTSVAMMGLVDQGDVILPEPPDDHGGQGGEGYGDSD